MSPDQGRTSRNRGRRFPVEVLTPDEVRAILAQCSTSKAQGLRTRALIVVLYRAGLRHSEALDLFPKDVDLVNGTIAVL